jgi:photosystem II stability/assembly factor-like uncharacterized protein
MGDAFARGCGTDGSVERRDAVASGRLLVLAATKVGLYLFKGDTERRSWQRSGPYLAPCDISHACLDPRDGAIWAAANGEQAWVYRSPNLGQTWRAMGGPFPAEKVWHVEPGRSDEPGTVYAGIMPAALYRSRDGGETWSELEALTSHPSREEWQGGGGGLCLHTIILPPERPGRLYVGISAVGMFRSDDNGESWRPINEGLADFLEIFETELSKPLAHRGIHRCVHKAVDHPADPDIFFQQNHLGVYRSDDAGDSWRSINAGLPTEFGFPIAIGAGPQPSIYVVPEDGETWPIRTVERLAVWRSTDGGATWTEATTGLPEGQFNILREGMDADPLSPTGVYVGTTSGTLHASRDGGDSWETMADDLPDVRSVKVGLIGEA